MIPSDNKKRSQSLKLYKKNTLELPRFYSKQKNTPSSDSKLDQADSEANGRPSQKNQKASIDKKRIAEIVSKIKVEKQMGQPQRNNNRNSRQQTKITASRKSNDEKYSPNLKLSYKLHDRPAYDFPIHQTKGSHQRKMTTEKRQTPNPLGIKQFRSKSLKNAGKIGLSQEETNMPEQSKWKSQRLKSKKIMTQNNHQIKVLIQKPNKNKINFIKDKRQQPKGQVIIGKMEIPTEDTQPNPNIFCDLERTIWNRTIQIFHQISRNIHNLQWPEEFIVMDKFSLQKKLYIVLDDHNLHKFKQKFKRHICISRIVIYMLANLILNEIEAHFMMGVVENIKSSYIGILEIVHRLSENQAVSKQTQMAIHRNNENTLKQVEKILKKKSIPYRNLLQNMLESSLKIDSFEFIAILDKTLKWELLKMPSFPYLPPPQKQYFLVLDLDETLIHYDYNEQVFHVRPFTQEFLKKISEFFEVVIFTAAIQDYADEIIKQIDPEHSVSYKLYRNHLTYIQGVAIKDLSMLGRPLNKTIIVDNISTNFRLQPQNGIQIRSWYDDDDDEILGKLYPLLIRMVDNHPEDLRNGIREYGSFIKEQITKSQLIYELKKQL